MVQPQFKGQTYGEGAAQERRVQAMPTGSAPTQQRAQQAARRVAPAAPGSLTAPTARPDEPITAGAPFGAGPGPEVLPIPIAPQPGSRADLAERVRVILAQFPNEALYGLAAELDTLP
jgi:hypothetical protein